MTTIRFTRAALLLLLVLAGGAPGARAAVDTALRLSNTGPTFTSYVRVPNSPAFSLQTFTLEAWLQQLGPGYGNTANGGAGIITKPIEGSVGTHIVSWHLDWISTGEISFNLVHTPAGSGVYLSTPQLPDPLARHHVAATFDGAMVRVYVDGVERASAPWTLGSVYYGANDVLIGATNFGSGFLRRFDGVIDDVRIWDHARSASEIAGTMNCALTGNEPGLVAYWPFDGSNLLDATGHGHHGGLGGTIGALSYAPLAPLGSCVTAVEPGTGPAARDLALSMSPQPATDRVTLAFELPRSGPVSLDVLDVSGRRLATWDYSELAAGAHRITRTLDDVHGRAPGSAVVFVRLRAGERIEVKPLVLRR